MAFGAWRGNAQAGGWPGVSQGGLSNMFAGFGEGLMEMAKSWNERDMAQKKLDYETARDAANHAFEMNLHRFESEWQLQRERESQGAQTVRERENRASQERISAATLTEHAKEREAQLGLGYANLAETKALRDIQQKNAETASARADVADKRAATAQQRADDQAQRNSVYEHIRGIENDNKDANAEIASLQRDLKDPSVSADEQAVIKSRMSELRQGIDMRRQESNDLRKSLSGPDLSAELAPADVGSADTGSASRFDQIESMPSGGGKASKPDLNDAQKAVLDDLNQRYPKQDNETIVRSRSPQQIQKAADVINSRKTADTGEAGAQDNSFLPADGSAPATAVASSSGPPPVAGFENSMAPGIEAGQPDAMAGQDAPESDQQPRQDNDSLAAQLQKTPGGQAVFASLDRLAGERPGPAADKLRRAAEIGLSQEIPDADPDSFIDDYLSQKQGEPETEMA